MVKHIIIWTLIDSLSDEKKRNVKTGIKQGLEGLIGKIDGLISIEVKTDFLPTSNGEVMLDSTFESIQALAVYSTHPEHIKVANEAVRPFTATRSCVDFEI